MPVLAVSQPSSLWESMAVCPSSSRAHRGLCLHLVHLSGVRNSLPHTWLKLSVTKLNGLHFIV